MTDHWQRYAAEERIRQLETELAELRAQRDKARDQLRHAVTSCEAIAKALGSPVSWDQGVRAAEQLKAECEQLKALVENVKRSKRWGAC